MIDQSYKNLSDQELSEKLTKLEQRISYVERTNLHFSTLPQLKMIRAGIILEQQSRIEKIKNDMYDQLFPENSKIIGEDE
jgi:predicted RND superfamily exporter protein